ncbi:MAG: transcriptional regulator, family [Akkermansiaceae bacterium]|nr:transcriptional regulator, family [Akkermansiaceae bacterium]
MDPAVGRTVPSEKRKSMRGASAWRSIRSSSGPLILRRIFRSAGRSGGTGIYYRRSSCIGTCTFTIYKLVLSAPVPPPSGKPSVLARFGDHLRAARIRNGPTRIQLAEIPGVTKFTVWNWEDCRNEPGTHQCARSIEFIGYDPFPIGLSLAERMLAFRRRRGLRTKDAAKLAGADPSSWSSWEHKASAALREKFEKLLRNELRWVHYMPKVLEPGIPYVTEAFENVSDPPRTVSAPLGTR